MAKCKANMATDLEKRLMGLGDRIDDIVPEVLKEGAAVLYQDLRANTEAVVREGTGELVKGLKVTKVKTSRAKTKYIAVEFSGYDTTRRSDKYPRGVPNALKARMFEKGGNGQAGKGFMRATEIGSAQRVNAAMKRKLEQMIND